LSIKPKKEKKRNCEINDARQCFVPDQQAKLDALSASSQKQQSAGRCVIPLVS